MTLHRRITCFVFAGMLLFGMQVAPAASAPLQPQNDGTQIEWREGRPRLAEFCETLSRRPSFQATAPA